MFLVGTILTKSGIKSSRLVSVQMPMKWCKVMPLHVHRLYQHNNHVLMKILDSHIRGNVKLCTCRSE